MSKITQLFRTTTFKLFAAFIFIFAVIIFLFMLYLTYSTGRIMHDRFRTQIVQETNFLQRQYDRFGLRRLVRNIERASRRPGAHFYLLAGQLGRPIAGNVDHVPSNIMQEPGFHTLQYQRENRRDQGERNRRALPKHDLQGRGQENADRGSADHKNGDGHLSTRDDHTSSAVVQVSHLSGGLILLVGKDVSERRQFGRLFSSAILIFVGIVIAVTIIGGIIIARIILGRIDTIAQTSQRIIEGELNERVPVRKRNDEFDQLGIRLNEMLDRIQRLMQGMKDVSSNVAHDLKTPLNRMRTRIEAELRDLNDIENTRAVLETTIEEADQLIDTFNAILLIDRVEAGAPGLNFEELDLVSLIQDIVELYEPVAEEGGIEIKFEAGPPINVPVNRELLLRALINLIENAIKYTKEGASEDKKIDLLIERDTDALNIIVADNGPGIPEDKWGQVFERFYRLEESRTQQGSGLGLSLVKAVVALHKGEVKLEHNQPGLRAVISLPPV